ncbi:MULTISPECIES: hypothetical protein [Neorhizobium]|uniref:hypothetical protein n=1 Tax=Neorhizobium TaxID=1525371 RepID=UPI00062244A6|nr:MULTISPECIES: hypothetical protein [Neorhizobium]MCJ9753680.1 hypothetical protein [Neorhizobium sp. BETTINA12A]CDZ48201.1 Hypothetical protein NGAL_HAMBI2427_25650 [Neorhizobium galegae bv. orientalis]
MTKMTSALAAALIASVSFAGAALAEGDYYQGVQKTAPSVSTSIDRTNTGSIDRQDGKLPFNNGGGRDNRISDLDSGDYYSGANRPN